MPYLIDSDWIIDHLKQVPEATNLIASLRGERLYISIITYMEAYQGTLRDADSSGTAERLKELLLIAPILEFDEAVAERCARIRESVRGGRVRANRRAHDLMIAATAIEHGLTLVTRNVDDFSDVTGLALHGV
jgi:predicted nucleic acid-binding protein